eukprot:TCONS_00043927-protein
MGKTAGKVSTQKGTKHQYPATRKSYTHSRKGIGGRKKKQERILKPAKKTYFDELLQRQKEKDQSLASCSKESGLNEEQNPESISDDESSSNTKTDTEEDEWYNENVSEEEEEGDSKLESGSDSELERSEIDSNNNYAGPEDGLDISTSSKIDYRNFRLGPYVEQFP